MNKYNKEWMKELEGSETWTNAFEKRFGERVNVMVKGKKLMHKGKKFVPTAKEFKKLQNDRLRQEYGTTDFKKIMKMEGF